MPLVIFVPLVLIFFFENSPLAPTTHVYHEFKQDEIGQNKLHVQCTDSCQ